MHALLGVMRVWLSLLAAALLLTGCLSDGGGGAATATTSITGTAATGAALSGTVDLVDANGVVVSRPIGLLGAFEIPTTGLSAPFILRATGSGPGGAILFSFADGPSGIFNITPLTHMALELLRQDEDTPPADLAALFAGWGARFAPANLADLQAAMLLAQRRINATLRTAFVDNGLTPTTFDFLRTRFSPDRTGLDAVLDSITGLVIAGGQIQFNVGGAPITFNIGIDISDITVGGGAGGVTPAACVGGGATLTFARNLSVAGPHANGDQVCFVASPTSLAFDGKTLTNPTQNVVVTLPFSAYAFVDVATGAKYEVVFNAGALHEINVLNSADAFHGQFAAAPVGGGGAGGAGGVTLRITAGGAGLADVNIPGVTAPASQAEFCADINDTNSATSLANALGSIGAITITSCSFAGGVGTVNANVAVTIPVAISVPYVVTFTFN